MPGRACESPAQLWHWRSPRRQSACYKAYTCGRPRQHCCQSPASRVQVRASRRRLLVAEGSVQLLQALHRRAAGPAADAPAVHFRDWYLPGKSARHEGFFRAVHLAR